MRGLGARVFRNRAALAAVIYGLNLASAANAAGFPMVSVTPSPEIRRFVAGIVATHDNRGLSFLVVDKIAASVFVFDSDGAMQGGEPALLGLALEDDVRPGIGVEKLSSIPPEERSTQAGRFMARFGPAVGMAEVLWIDYSTSLSLHPVITTNLQERRIERLQSISPEDNRITFGCVNVSTEFYDDVIRRTLGRVGVVYILPETKALIDVFPALHAELK